MAVKIIRQPKKIALLGSPTSAAAPRAGRERAPESLRAAGLADRLKSAGFEVTDLGNAGTYLFEPDDEHPRARNVSAVLKSMNDLRPRVEVAVKSGALPLILSGDCMPVLATIAAARRYYRNVSLIYFDRDADLKEPATTTNGFVDGMVISQIIGRGAPELVRFWGEPPLVRGPDIALFGVERLEPSEEQFLLASPIRRHLAHEVSSQGGAKAARMTLERVHVAKNEFVLHVDLDVIASEEFPWTDSPGAGGLTLKEVRDAVRVFASQPNLTALEVAGYNPALDPEGQGARVLVDFLAEVLAGRLDDGSTDAAGETVVASEVSAPAASEAPQLEPAPVAETASNMPTPADPDSPAS